MSLLCLSVSSCVQWEKCLAKGQVQTSGFFFFFLSPPSVILRCFSVSLEDYRSEADVRENEQSIINAGFLFVCLFFCRILSCPQ